MPPSGFNKHVVEGALSFVKGCYLDLLAEVRSGKHSSYEEAIEFELRQIEKVLLSIHINAEGELVERTLDPTEPPIASVRSRNVEFDAPDVELVPLPR
jgi:hypothetical protein